MIYFTSDLHLGHANILPSRPQFSSIEEHDAYLMRQWNNKVHKGDDVYILGDLSFRSPHPISYYLRNMKGRKHLILGNHDSFWIRNVEDMSEFFESVDTLKQIKFQKKQITLCHFPMLEYDGSREQSPDNLAYLIHGHIHGLRDPKVYGYIKENQPHALNASVDVNDFAPVTFEELVANNNKWYGRK